MSASEPRLRLMAVLAHPDDESLGLGGTLARYAAEGADVHVVTATRGEAGRFGHHRSGPGHPGPRELGRIRERELRAACEVLGLGAACGVPCPKGGVRVQAYAGLGS